MLVKGFLSFLENVEPKIAEAVCSRWAIKVAGDFCFTGTVTCSHADIISRASLLIHLS